jgi:hypothetical protein
MKIGMAVHVGHLDVEERQLKHPRFQVAKGFRGAPGGDDLATFALKDHGQRLAQIGFVVHDQDRRNLGHWIAVLQYTQIPRGE